MSRIDDIRARLRELEREVAQLERFGRDRFVDGDVIRFTKTYEGETEPKLYTYAAIKTSRGWYTTAQLGRSRHDVFAYDELIEFITKYPVATDVEVATHWVDVTLRVETEIERSTIDESPIVQTPHAVSAPSKPRYGKTKILGDTLETTRYAPETID